MTFIYYVEKFEYICIPPRNYNSNALSNMDNKYAKFLILTKGEIIHEKAMSSFLF